MGDYYQILGVGRQASTQEITTAYKKLAIRWHPDKNKNNREEAEKKFKEINEAHSVLSDENKRKIYDRFGKDAVNQMGNGGPGGMPPGGMPDIFSQFFGGAVPGAHFQSFGGGPGFTFTSFQRGPPDPLAQYRILKHKIQVSLADIYLGNIVEYQTNKRTAPNGEVKASREQFTILKGMDYGQNYQIRGKGHFLDKNRYGDLVITLIPDVNHPSNKRFIRRGADLHYTMPLSLKQSLLGFSIPLVHLDGRILQIESERVVIHGSTKIIQGQGMPFLQQQHRPGQPAVCGKLVIHFEVETPQKLPDELKEKLGKILPNTERDKKYRIKGDFTKYSVDDGVQAPKQSTDDANHQNTAQHMPGDPFSHPFFEDSDDDNEGPHNIECAQQ